MANLSQEKSGSVAHIEVANSDTKNVAIRAENERNGTRRNETQRKRRGVMPLLSLSHAGSYQPPPEPRPTLGAAGSQRPAHRLPSLLIGHSRHRHRTPYRNRRYRSWLVVGKFRVDDASTCQSLTVLPNRFAAWVSDPWTEVSERPIRLDFSRAVPPVFPRGARPGSQRQLTCAGSSRWGPCAEPSRWRLSWSSEGIAIAGPNAI
jgi:hypothetical protein